MGNCSFKHDDENGVISGLQNPVPGILSTLLILFRTNK